MDPSRLVPLAALLALGCMRDVPASQALPALDEEILLRSETGELPLDAALNREGGVLAGHLTWSTSCERAVVTRLRRQELVHRAPNYPLAVAEGVGALATGVAGAELLTHLDDFSTERTCETDNEGTLQCSSPRGTATGGGVTLVATSVGLTTASIVTLASRPSTARGDVDEGPAGPPRVLARDVPCGSGPVAGVGLAVYRTYERIAASTTDGDGNVEFNLPEWLTGPVTVVVDSVPPGSSALARGQTVGRITIPPAAESSSAPAW